MSGGTFINKKKRVGRLVLTAGWIGQLIEWAVHREIIT
jgi:hypothetical protein